MIDFFLFLFQPLYVFGSVGRVLRPNYFEAFVCSTPIVLYCIDSTSLDIHQLGDVFDMCVIFTRFVHWQRCSRRYSLGSPREICDVPETISLAWRRTLGYQCVAHNLLFPTICVLFHFGCFFSRLRATDLIFQISTKLNLSFYMEIRSNIHLLLLKSIDLQKTLYTIARITALPCLSHELH